jgi:sortase A
MSGKALTWRIIACVLLIVGIAPVGMMIVNNMHESYAVESHAKEVSSIPSSQRKSIIRNAVSYNHGIASSPQSSLGDPYPKASISYPSSYTNALRTDDGIMATISIPSISLKLPVRHGTSEQVLNQGLGHLYGTSLPVGGESTRSVIAGHRGKPNNLLLTRADELSSGDMIYVDVMGERLSYKVSTVSVIEPEQVSELTVVKGKDMITLLTCTPYGVNTHRLVIDAIRVKDGTINNDDQKDHVLMYAVIIMFDVIMLIASRMIIRNFHRNRFMIMNSITERLM